MLRLLSLTAIVCAAALSGSAGTDVTWKTDYLDALKVAKAEKKVVLVDFTGSDWCGWCKRLQAEVFTQPEFLTWAGEKAVLLEIDFPRQKELSEGLRKQNAELQEKFKIEGYPTIVFLDGDGKEVGRTGYVKGGPAAWIKEAESVIKVAPTTTWTESWDDAVKRAKAEKKPILADFTGSDWCIWCQRLDKEVFEQEAFSKWAAEKVVLLKLDFPKKHEQDAKLKKQNDELMRKYEISGFPTVLFLDAEGKKLGESGYLEGGPSKWIESAKGILGGKGSK